MAHLVGSPFEVYRHHRGPSDKPCGQIHIASCCKNQALPTFISRVAALRG